MITQIVKIHKKKYKTIRATSKRLILLLGGGATRPFAKDGGADGLYGYPNSPATLQGFVLFVSKDFSN